MRIGSDGVPDTADVARIAATIAGAGDNADVVLAYHHNHLLEAGGRRTPQWQRQFAHDCLDAGAALYVGHGAPRLHGIEIYHGRLIFYDLGNFIFQTRTEQGFYDAEVWQSVVAECHFDSSARLHTIRLTPLQLNAIGIDGPANLQRGGGRQSRMALPRTPSSID